MDSVSPQTHHWVQAYLDDQRQLIRKYTSLQGQGGLPSDITIHHRRGWVLSNSGTVFLNRFPGLGKGKHLYLVELIWKVRAFPKASGDGAGSFLRTSLMQVPPVLQPDKQGRAAAVSKMVSCGHGRPALTSGIAGELRERLLEVPQSGAEIRQAVEEVMEGLWRALDHAERSRNTHATLRRALSDTGFRVKS